MQTRPRPAIQRLQLLAAVLRDSVDVVPEAHGDCRAVAPRPRSSDAPISADFFRREVGRDSTKEAGRKKGGRLRPHRPIGSLLGLAPGRRAPLQPGPPLGTAQLRRSRRHDVHALRLSVEGDITPQALEPCGGPAPKLGLQRGEHRLQSLPNLAVADDGAQGLLRGLQAKSAAREPP